jgi:hypothetical protein
MTVFTVDGIEVQYVTNGLGLDVAVAYMAWFDWPTVRPLMRLARCV